MLLTRPRWLAGMSYLPFHTPELKIFMVSFISSFIPYKEWCIRLFSRTRYYNKFFHLPYLPVLQNAFTQCCLNQEHHSRDRDMLHMRLCCFYEKQTELVERNTILERKGRLKLITNYFSSVQLQTPKLSEKWTPFSYIKLNLFFSFAEHL